MSRFFSLVLILLVAMADYSFAQEYRRISCYDEVLAQVREKTVVVFDIDDVLVAPAISWVWDKDFIKTQLGWMDDDLASATGKEFLRSLRFPMRYQLIDEDIAQVFSGIVERGGKIIALSAREKVETALESFFENEGIRFDAALTKNPILKGMICTKRKDKGQTLFAELDELPAFLLFVDDKIENCLSVEKACEERNIPCVVYVYDRQVPEDESIRDLQYNVWKNRGSLITDREAQDLDANRCVLLKALLSLNLHDQNPLWDIHRGWIEKLFSFVKNCQEGYAAYPEDYDHPIYFLDQSDGRQIVQPLFQGLYHFELTDDWVDRLFLAEVPWQEDDGRGSSIESLKDDSALKETHRVAQIVSEMTSGQCLFILGQTPAYLIEMVRAIDQESGGMTQFIQVPFSGRPDSIKMLRRNKFLLSTSFLDIVTPAGREKFLTHLERQSFSPKRWQSNPKKLFVIDNSTGASVRCFLAQMKSWFEEEGGIPFPEITFLEMCAPEELSIQNERGEWVTLEKPDLEFGNGISFEIPIVFLGMEHELLKSFDKVNDALRLVPPFNGLLWSKDYLESHFAKYPTSQAEELAQLYRTYASHAPIPSIFKSKQEGL